MRIEVLTARIQYYAIYGYGLYTASDEVTGEILTEVTADTNTPQRVRELAEYILHDVDSIRVCAFDNSIAPHQYD
jgi:hypothetical protein